jgi:hypothetical protein
MDGFKIHAFDEKKESKFSNFDDLAKYAVPSIPSERAKYIFIADKKCTEYLTMTRASNIPILKVQNVYNKILDYYISHRVVMLDKEHRCIFFIAIAKLTLLLYRSATYKQKKDMNLAKENCSPINKIIDLDELEKLGLRIKHIDFDQINLNNYWSFLCYVSEKAIDIRYHREMFALVQAFLCRFGEFLLCMERNYTGTLNNRKFTRKIAIEENNRKVEYIVVDTSFINEVERYTFALSFSMRSRSIPYTDDFKERIDQILKENSLTVPQIETIQKVIPDEINKRLLRMLKTIPEPVLQSAEAQMLSIVCEALLIHGEKEKYVEKWPQDGSDAYSILCKFRISVVDAVNNWINIKPFEYVIERHMEELLKYAQTLASFRQDNNNIQTTINTQYHPIYRVYDATCELIVSKFIKSKWGLFELTNYIVYLDRSNLNQPYPSKYLAEICNDVVKKGVKTLQVPLMVKCLEEWYCVDAKSNKVYRLYSFFECFTKWVQLCDEDGDIKGVLPDGLPVNKIRCIMEGIPEQSTEKIIDLNTVIDNMETENKSESEKENEPEDDMDYEKQEDGQASDNQNPSNIKRKREIVDEDDFLSNFEESEPSDYE